MGPINLSIRGNRARRTGAPPIPPFLTVDGTFRRKTSAARANEDATAETPPPEQLPRFVNLVSFIFLHSTHGTTSNLPHLPHASPNRYPVPQICAAPAIRIHPCHLILGCHVTPQFNHARRNPTTSTPIPPHGPQLNHAHPNSTMFCPNSTASTAIPPRPPQFHHIGPNSTTPAPIPPHSTPLNHIHPNSTAPATAIQPCASMPVATLHCDCPSHRCHVMRAETLRFNHAATIQLCPFNVLYMPLLYYIMLLL